MPVVSVVHLNDYKNGTHKLVIPLLAEIHRWPVRKRSTDEPPAIRLHTAL